MSKINPPSSQGHGTHVLTVWGTIICFCLAALIATYMFFVEAPPPRRIVIATGGTSGAYYKFAVQYAKELSDEGLTLDVRDTKGSVENLELLRDDASGVSVAIVQSGAVPAEDRDHYEALGSLFREPLWVFYRSAYIFGRLGPTLDGALGVHGRIGIGPPGSGTQKIAMQLLAANGIKAVPDKFELIEDPVDVAAVKLQKGELDVAFFVAAFDADYVKKLMEDKNVKLLSFDQHEAYHRKYRFLSEVTIPAGLADLGKNLPPENISLVAPTAMLIGRKDLHPAIVTLLLTTATHMLAKGDELSDVNEFPSPSFTDVPISKDARHFYKSGPPVLQRIMPYWLASLVDRLKVMLIPLIMLMMPLFRAAPPLVRWRTRRKIYLWYSVLRDIDKKIVHGLSSSEVNVEIARLHEIDRQVAFVEVPLSYMEEFYHLRLHLTMVREALEKLQQSDPTSPER